MLKLDKVTYSTPPPRMLKIFEGILFEVPEKKHTLIFGENGSGKSTLVKLLMKFIEPSSGIVEGGTEKAVTVFEDYDDQLFFSTVSEEFSNTIDEKSEEYYKTISMLDLEGLLGRSTFELSYSQKARLVFALAYLSKKEFMIIDCPPKDEKIYSMINHIIDRQERTVVMLFPLNRPVESHDSWNKYRIEDKKIVKC